MKKKKKREKEKEKSNTVQRVTQLNKNEKNKRIMDVKNSEIYLIKFSLGKK